jgi:hypothetical protein
MKTNVGIWIDQREAIIVVLTEKEKIHHILSHVTEGNVHGGYGSSKKYLPQDAVSETGLTRKKEQQLHDFYTRVVKRLPRLDSLYIFGPGSTGKKLQKEVEKVMEYKDRIVAVEPSDSMTLNQLRAKVREVFQQKQHTS